MGVAMYAFGKVEIQLVRQCEVHGLRHNATFDGIDMKLIREELGEEQVQGESFPSMLQRAIQLVLECSSAEAVQILEQRVQAVEAIQLHGILESEEAQDCLHEDDKKVVKSMGKQQQSAGTLAVELWKTIRHARSSGAAPATKRARKGVQSNTLPRRIGNRRVCRGWHHQRPGFTRTTSMDAGCCGMETMPMASGGGLLPSHGGSVARMTPAFATS